VFGFRSGTAECYCHLFVFRYIFSAGDTEGKKQKNRKENTFQKLLCVFCFVFFSKLQEVDLIYFQCKRKSA